MDLKQLIDYWEKELQSKSDIIPEPKKTFISDTLTALKQQRKLTEALRTFALATNSIMQGVNLD